MAIAPSNRIHPLSMIDNAGIDDDDDDDDDDPPGQDFAQSNAHRCHSLPCNGNSIIQSQLDSFSCANQSQRKQNVTTWDSMTGYLPCPIIMMSFRHLSEQRKQNNYFSGILHWWIWIRSSLGIVVESTMALLVVPLSFILWFWSLQLLEYILPTILPMTSMVLFHDWRNHGSTTMTAVTMPRLEGLVIVALTMVIMGGIGSFCSWMETEFVRANPDTNLDSLNILEVSKFRAPHFYMLTRVG